MNVEWKAVIIEFVNGIINEWMLDIGNEGQVLCVQRGVFFWLLLYQLLFANE